jgi:hypothetical protein
MVLFLNQKTLDLLKFQNELPTKMDNYIGTLYKTESLNCKIIGLERSQMEFLFVVLLLLL